MGKPSAVTSGVSQAAQRRAFAIMGDDKCVSTARACGGRLRLASPLVRLSPTGDSRAIFSPRIDLLSDGLQALWISQLSGGPRKSMRRTSLLIRRKRRLGRDCKLEIDIPQTTPTGAGDAPSAAAAVAPVRLTFAIETAPPAVPRAPVCFHGAGLASPLLHWAYLQGTPAPQLQLDATSPADQLATARQ